MPPATIPSRILLEYRFMDFARTGAPRESLADDPISLVPFEDTTEQLQSRENGYGFPS